MQQPDGQQVYMYIYCPSVQCERGNRGHLGRVHCLAHVCRRRQRGHELVHVAATDAATADAAAVAAAAVGAAVAPDSSPPPPDNLCSRNYGYFFVESDEHNLDLGSATWAATTLRR